MFELASVSLGWAGDERDRAYFEWKHRANPFGRSPAWLAFVGGRPAGLRTYMRWRIRRGDTTMEVVRAVDTSTHPDFRGRGIFTVLTLDSIGGLAEDGIEAVFNTPNERSRPGYLKMGWDVLGRPTLWAVPRSPMAAVSARHANLAWDCWSDPVTTGEPAVDALTGIQDHLETLAPSKNWSTDRDERYLRWRYGFEPLNYRAVEVNGGLCVFRVSHRRETTQVSICEWLSNESDRSAVSRLVNEVGDYAVGVGLSVTGQGAVPLPRRGPHVTWRSLTPQPAPRLSELDLSLGDLELF